MSNLNVSSSIPSHARGAVRAFIKGQAGFEAWIAAKGIESRNALNSHLIEYALENGLADQVEAIMSAPSLPAAMETACEEFDKPAAPAAPAAPMVDAPAADPIVVSAILAPVEAFLSPLVRAELEKALAPVIHAANKPATVVEKIVEKTITVTQNLAPLPVGAMPYAVQQGKVTIGSLFGFRGNDAGKMISTWESHGAAPFIDPFYVIDKSTMAMLATAIERGSNVWLGGPSGTGKSTMPEQFAAYTGRPCVTFSFDAQTEIADLLGGQAVMADGSTGWVDGALIQAVKRPGTVIILDELTASNPGVQFVFHGLASDSRSYVLPTGEKVTCAPGVVFVAADNTFGFGDETGQYAGTHVANAALVNRFKRVLAIDYLSKAEESKALHNHTLAPKPACDALAEFVARARKMPEMEGIVLSLRQMIGFVQCVQDGFAAKPAFQATFLNRLPRAERAALETLFTLQWSNEFTQAMTGSAGEPAAPSENNSPAAQAFDDEISASFTR